MKRFLAIGAGAFLALATLQSPALAESPHYVDDPSTVDCSVGANNKYWFKYTETTTDTWTETDSDTSRTLVNSPKAAKEVWRVSVFNVTTEFTETSVQEFHYKVCNNGKREVSAVGDAISTLSHQEIARVLVSSFIENPGSKR
jgi:hypothetical protein